ncbi:MAG: AAA family ATPase [Clostridia bacterium]|nr:AAA family ATPase [Clostridia bacterium]
MSRERKQQTAESSARPVPLGVDDFAAFSEGFCCVDKTLLIKKVMDSRTPVTLFARPQGFGKSFNLSMLRTFFEKSGKNTPAYFKGRDIWKCGRRYREEQGKYPVIYLSFRNAAGDSWETASGRIMSIIAEAFASFPELLAGRKVNPLNDLPYCMSMASGSLDLPEYEDALLKLSRMLKAHYHVAPVIIIDDYDVPVRSGYEHGYYGEAAGFMRNFLSAGLKGNNSNIHYAFMAGEFPISLTDTYGGLNNICASTVLDCDDYSGFFGFTAEETKSVLEHYGLADRYPEVCEWYGGYKSGSDEIFCPQSVFSFIRSNGQAGACRMPSDTAGIIHAAISGKAADILLPLLKGDPVIVHIDRNISFSKLKTDPSYACTILLHSGYLNAVEAKQDANTWTLAVPNKESREALTLAMMSATDNSHVLS